MSFASLIIAILLFFLLIFLVLIIIGITGLKKSKQPEAQISTTAATEIKQKKPITVKSATATLSWIALGLIVSVIIFYAISIIIFLFGVIIGVMDGFGIVEFLKAVSKVFG
ncbi:MAG: hypothetical protein KAS78_05905 [Candidatus Pacebacteria bacterium]|nr:hypothetical protein [Candidatus Paceibacterota bacterium]